MKPYTPSASDPRALNRKERRARALNLVEQGWTQVAVAQHLGLASQTVHNYVKTHRKEKKVLRPTEALAAIADKTERLIQLSKDFRDADPKTRVILSQEISKITGDYAPERKIELSIVQEIKTGAKDLEQDLAEIEAELQRVGVLPSPPSSPANAPILNELDSGGGVSGDDITHVSLSNDVGGTPTPARPPGGGGSVEE